VTVQEITKKFQREQMLTQRAFAAKLTESLKEDISHVTVMHWLNGRTEPQTDLLFQTASLYEDWRRTWAIECLRAKLPEVFDDADVLERLCNLLQQCDEDPK
jgi:transcriptional regulator with XRE-family HTH domain